MISPETLRRYPYFAEVSEESLREVAMVSNVETYPAGTVIFREGDKATKLYILVKGEVNISYTLGSGELRTVDTLVPGELLMWSTLVKPYRSTAVSTTRQETEAITIDGERLRSLCEKDHDLGYSMLISLTELLAARLEGARVQLATVD